MDEKSLYAHILNLSTPWTAKRKMVAKIGTFVGRTIPLLGVIIIASDVSQIVYCSVRDYNLIARENDKLW